LTGTPIPVNTAKWSVISRTSVIYLACGYFKQTFVLDPESGVDIMRRLREKRGSFIAAFVDFAKQIVDATPNLQLEKTVEP